MCDRLRQGLLPRRQMLLRRKGREVQVRNRLRKILLPRRQLLLRRKSREMQVRNRFRQGLLPRRQVLLHRKGCCGKKMRLWQRVWLLLLQENSAFGEAAGEAPEQAGSTGS